jgi:fatty acid desaturase
VWFVLPIVIQVMFAMQMGADVWWALCGLPLLVFSWVYSAQLYVYHYRTTVGPETRFHARRLDQGRVVSWWLLNLNHHDTHHRCTKVVWYDLPQMAQPLPLPYSANQQHRSFARGLLDQLKGPTVVEM